MTHRLTDLQMLELLSRIKTYGNACQDSWNYHQVSYVTGRAVQRIKLITS